LRCELLAEYGAAVDDARRLCPTTGDLVGEVEVFELEVMVGDVVFVVATEGTTTGDTGVNGCIFVGI
jgi:hypothetical protein